MPAVPSGRVINLLPTSSLFAHLRQCFAKSASSFSLPLPVVPMLSCGKAVGGKVRAKGVLLIPRPGADPSVARTKIVECLFALKVVFFAGKGWQCESTAAVTSTPSRRR